MRLDDGLLEVLRCPETRTRVQKAELPLVQSANTAIAKRNVEDRGGRVVEEKVDGLLVREDGKVAYAVRDDIPEMIVDRSFFVDDIS